MGEFADDALDRALDELFDYMAERGWHPRRPRGVACQFCQMRGLRWVETSEGWRLFADDEMHDCRNQPASPDEFDEVA